MSKVKKIKKSGMTVLLGDQLKEALSDIEQFSTKKQITKSGIDEILVSKIKLNPFQPRKIFKKDEIKQLADSIATNGLITPIAVVKDAAGFILIAGERRLKAHQLNKTKTIKAYVLKVKQDKLQEMALIENIQREDLNGIEEAQAFQSLIIKHKLTQDDLGKRISKSRTYVTNLLRLLKLPKIVQQMILDDKLSVGHGKVLLSLENSKDILDFANKVVKNNLSIRALEELVKGKQVSSGKKVKRPKSKDIKYAEGLLRDKLGTKVLIKNKKIVISYSSTSDLNRIIEEMGALEK